MPAPTPTPHLDRLITALDQLATTPATTPYHLPRLWERTPDASRPGIQQGTQPGTQQGTQQDPATELGTITVEPATWYRDRCIALRDGTIRTPYPLDTNATTDWHQNAIIYNLFVRLATAFDHNADGTLDTTELPSGFRETGTLLKAIALIPYIASLGANTIYLLPMTAIGELRRKGTLGSPYSIRSHYQLDPMLGEPILTPIGPEELLQALVEAAHIAGMRVVVEFIFRTAAPDSEWRTNHPDWFYWIKGPDTETDGFGPPHFDDDTLRRIHNHVDRNELDNLPAPPDDYRSRFTAPPQPPTTPNGTATTPDGQPCHIASAFSDWPPDDRQPAWSDVTYLKLHTHPAFNYIAYNTIRMYDRALDAPEHRTHALWQKLTTIIPAYIDCYAIDGAMIDMGHALPGPLKRDIIDTARARRPHFTFWDENFNTTPETRAEGFDAVLGSLPFVVKDIIYIRGLLNHLNRTGIPIPFFATGENHNTPRLAFRYPRQAAGRNHARFIITLGAMLPAIPFIHAGIELLEWHPINLGLDFTDEDRRNYPIETLPLFGVGAFDWANSNTLEPLTSYIRTINDIRQTHATLLNSPDAGTISVPFTSQQELFAIRRHHNGQALLFIGNSDPHHPHTGWLEFSTSHAALTDCITGAPYTITDHKLTITLEPGQCLIMQLPDEPAETTDEAP